MADLSEETKFTIPLKNLVALVIGVGIAATAYFELTERVSFNEHQRELLSKQIQNIESKVGDFIPRDLVTNSLNRQREIELNISRMDQRLKTLEAKIRDMTDG